MLSATGDSQTAIKRAGSVEGLLAQFDTNPFGISRALRQLRDFDPGRFQEAALRAIAELPETSAIRFLATLVPLSEPVLELIANPKAFEQQSARRIVEVMRRIDIQTEAKLLRLISANPARPLAPQMMDRILDLVDAVSEGPRLLPVLMQIFRLANPYLRARLALSIGKHHRNKDWLEDRMRDPDARVRANCVEANWSQKDETALALFNAGLRDQHHRVLGNGAVGLYLAGDIRSLAVFGELLVHEDPHFRAAGFWAIGHVQDTRFQPGIERIAEDEDESVRRSAAVAQGRLKRALEMRDEQPKLKLRLIKATRRPLGALSRGDPPGAAPAIDTASEVYHNHLFLEVKNAEEKAVVGLKDIQFQVFENDGVILHYSVRARTSYIKPGCYDVYFDAVAKPKMAGGQSASVRHLKILVLTQHATGEHETYDFGEPVPVQSDTLEQADDAEAGRTWDAFRS